MENKFLKDDDFKKRLEASELSRVKRDNLDKQIDVFIEDIKNFSKDHEIVDIDCFIIHDGNRFSTRGLSTGSSRFELAGKYLHSAVRTLFQEELTDD